MAGEDRRHEAQQRAERVYLEAVARAAAEYQRLIGAAVAGFGVAMTHASTNLATAMESASQARNVILGPAQAFFASQAVAAERAAQAIIAPAQEAFLLAEADAQRQWDLIAPEAERVYQAQLTAAQAVKNAADREAQQVPR